MSEGKSKGKRESAKWVTLRLPYREPYDFDGLLEFMAVRATPGVEQVSRERYLRAVQVGGEQGFIEVTHHPRKPELRLRVKGIAREAHKEVRRRVRQMFDVDAAPDEVMRAFRADKELHALARSNPGQRLPGAWDPFEVAVRAIVGQQVSVKGATTVMGVIAERFSESSSESSTESSTPSSAESSARGDSEVASETDRFIAFPSAKALSRLRVDDLPMPSARAAAIKSLSSLVARGEIDFSEAQDGAEFERQLMSIRGIGPWTAQYVAMRALGNPDAFLAGDLVLRRVAASKLGASTESALLERAELWRPWRAYACLHLWRHGAAAG